MNQEWRPIVVVIVTTYQATRRIESVAIVVKRIDVVTAKVRGVFNVTQGTDTCVRASMKNKERLSTRGEWFCEKYYSW